MSRFAFICTWTFIFLMLVMLFSVALWPDALAATSPLGLSYGHLLILIIHICPVIAAWYYIFNGEVHGEEDPS